MGRRASSTVLGALLFIIIVISIAFFIFSISINYHIAIKAYMKKVEEKRREKIEIIEVKKGDGKTEITVINTGSIDVKIVSVYINHILVKTLNNFYIPAGSERKIILESIDLHGGDYIKIATERGNFAVYTVRKQT